MKILDTYLARACLILLTPPCCRFQTIGTCITKNKLGENANEQYLVTYTLDTGSKLALLLINV